MVFTPPTSFVVRSRDYGVDDEIFSSTASVEVLPDHYVKRLWRKNAVPTTASFAIGAGANSAANLADNGLTYHVQYINKSPDSSDRSVAFSSTSNDRELTVRHGESGKIIVRVEWNNKNIERSSVTTENQTGLLVKDFVSRVGFLSSTLQSRSFVGPDNVEYKWKMIYCGNNPLYPDTFYRELRCSDSRHPVATTARLTVRDGNVSDESHPIYIAERGLSVAPWIVATNAVLDRVQVKPS
ncbi:hypothetical protein GYMLUDRAFT_428220 [Collybiopsis luxurians FD-317 M1]|uniref:DUF6593 domain-containing protein n=1 Tax=Collybiopsis luxurians FD-317 M1 TaxID=944289 RepID=A0A0D0CW97_9AGAR|nr:hypothetical protein GYMLUDRAFT_428220 [Collybiopsis luxurians FD-317 M1]